MKPIPNDDARTVGDDQETVSNREDNKASDTSSCGSMPPLIEAHVAEEHLFRIRFLESMALLGETSRVNTLAVIVGVPPL